MVATQRQKDFVDDMEAALKALQHQGVVKPKNSQLLEHAGVHRASMDAMVSRLADDPAASEYIARLKKVFSHALKMPQSIADLMDADGAGEKEKDDLKLDDEHITNVYYTGSAESIQTVEKNLDLSIKSWSPYVPPADSQEILNHILTALKPLNREQRETVLSSAGRFYRVGE